MIYTNNSDIKTLINKTISDNGLKKVYIANKLGISHQQLNNILNKKNITLDDMNSIINVIGYAINIDIVPLPGQQQDMATGPEPSAPDHDD